MYRLLVLCAIVTIAEPYREQCRGNQCSGTTRRPLQTLLGPVLRNVIEQEEQFLQFCRQNSPAIIGEKYGTDNYYLTYDLPEARNSVISVRIKHKFLLVTATERDGSNQVIFEDVKVLPDLVKADDAKWAYENQQTLKITIPYKFALGEDVGKNCGDDINRYFIDVPGTNPNVLDYEGQDSTENTHNMQASGSYGSNDRNQEFSEDRNNMQATHSYGSNDRNHVLSQHRDNMQTSRSYGSNYGSQDSTEDENSHPRPNKPYYRSQHFAENKYNAQGSNSYGSNDWPQGSSGNNHNGPDMRDTRFRYRSRDSTDYTD